MAFPWALVFGLGISKRCNTILRNFEGWSFVFSGISKGKGKVTNIKTPGVLSKKYILKPPCLDFFWNSSLAFFKQQNCYNKMTSVRKYYISKKLGNILAFEKESKRKLLLLIISSFIKNFIYIYIYIYIYLLRSRYYNNVRLFSKIKNTFFCCANISQPFR